MEILIIAFEIKHIILFIAHFLIHLVSFKNADLIMKNFHNLRINVVCDFFFALGFFLIRLSSKDLGAVK